MQELTFFEKLGVLFDNIIAHPLFIILLLSPVVIFAFNKKITKKFVIGIYVLVLLCVLFVGNFTIFSLLDNLIDGLFMTLYFPNFITLLVVCFASAIIGLITFFKKNMLRANKIINIIGFVVVQTIFCLVLTVIQVNDIDIYKENALYVNSDVLTLMQLLMGAFALQIAAMIIFTAIDKLTKVLDAKDEKAKKFRNIEKSKEFVNSSAENLFDDSINDKKTFDNLVSDVSFDNIETDKSFDYGFFDQVQEPLDKSLIDKEKIEPINLIDAINEEKVVTPEIFEASTKDSKELIADLVIVDLNKTILAVKSVKRIYTM